ncbi:TonB-dependent receptor domain-containing protein, partial [Steroidobacter sp.]|uniref:TonB-dependent receptor domain-containing protein n=1 Tax=Steroidobacter sp. TaxID=1978227 RepID=UPI001A52F1BB
ALVDLPNDWQLESDYTLTRNQSTFSSFGLHTQNLPAAINAGTVDPFVDTLANPLNMAFYGGAYGGDFPSRLGNVALRVAGPLGHLPAGRPTLTIGLEHRKESLDAGDYYWAFPQFPSRNVQRDYLPKSQRVLSAYAEMKVPLVSAANSLPLVRELDLQISGRSERFKVATGTAFVSSPTEPVTENEASFSATSPTIGVRFKPFEQLMLRASYATGFLPPDYVQFLAPTLGGGFVSGPGSLTSVVDPRRGNEVVATQFMAGGNPNIEPQNSTSWSVGAVWTPQYLKGLRANLEWYRLTLKDVALTPTAQQIVDLESQFQGRIQRDAVAPGDPYGVGRINLVDYSLINAASTKTEGLDMSIAYRFGIGSLGSLEFSGIGTVIKHFQRQTTLGGPMVDIVNQVANGGPLQRKGNLSLSWWREAWQVDWTLTHFGSYRQSDNPAFVLAQGSRSIPSQSYHDLVVKYDWDAGLTVQVGVSNVFNDVPPLDVFYDRTSYYSPFGDARLREYWLSLNQRF